MLTVRFETDLSAIYRTLGIEGEPFGSNFVMYDGDKPVALWRMKIVLEDMPVGVIESVRFLDTVDEDDRTFFMHAMFFKLSEGSPIRLRVEGERDEYRKFGFQPVDGNMEINSTDINLHYRCGGYRE